MSGTVVEYAHTYVDRVLDGAEPPDLTHVRQFLSDYPDATKLVIVDDTNVRSGEDFEQVRQRATDEWVGALSIEPDVVLYESHFTDAIEWFMDRVSAVNRGELNETTLGKRYSATDHGTYLYYNNGAGPERARITDERPDAKTTGYTCGAYDAAMTLCKLGELPSPDDRIVGDRAVTFHDPAYLGSPPFAVSEGIRMMLNEAGIVAYDESRVHNVPETAEFTL